MTTLSDVYGLAADGFLPRLQTLRVTVVTTSIKTTATDSSFAKQHRLANLRAFDLCLDRQERAAEGERSATWLDVEKLLSPSVMPCLSRCSLVYTLAMDDDIREIAQSSLFADGERHVRIQFALYAKVSITANDPEVAVLRDIRFGHVKDVYAELVSAHSRSSTSAIIGIALCSRKSKTSSQ